MVFFAVYELICYALFLSLLDSEKVGVDVVQWILQRSLQVYKTHKEFSRSHQ